MQDKIIFKDAQNICEQINLNCLSGKTVLVTGASGLIGTYFLACLSWLCEQGANIQVYAQIFSDPSPYILRLTQNSNFEIIRADLADFADYARLPEADVIIHSAGYAQPLRFMANPLATLQINTSATIALLKRLRHGGQFLFLSSSEVYCGLKDILFQETAIGTTTPFHPRASYIEGKRCGEAICNALYTQGVHAIPVRLGDVYGPGTRKHDKRALTSFIEKALCYGKIELMDAGTAVRTYCYVVDVVELLWKILLHGKEDVYNVGGHSTITIGELAQMIGKIINVPVIFPSNQKEVAGSPIELHQDLRRVETEFGKTHYVSLEEGLKVTIEWQRQLYLQGRQG